MQQTTDEEEFNNMKQDRDYWKERAEALEQIIDSLIYDYKRVK